MKLGDILNSINTGKEPIVNRDNEREYPAFIVARCFANFPDSLFHANELNLRRVSDRKQHYDYLFHALRKRKRFSPWLKKAEDRGVEAVMWFYSVSRPKAEEYLRILAEADKEKILKQYDLFHKN